MKVTREDLDGTQIQRLVVVDSDAPSHHAGQVAAYLCPECMQADETLGQIWHQDSCSLAGKHGRRHYDELEPVVDEGATPEFDADHPIHIVRFAETEGRGGLHEGEVLAFTCGLCGNSDEDCFEIIHDEACELSGCSDVAASPAE